LDYNYLQKFKVNLSSSKAQQLSVYFILLDVTNHGDMTQNDVFLLPDRETVAEPIQNEDEGKYIYINYSYLSSDI
jgi:hypothetical protein